MLYKNISVLKNQKLYKQAGKCDNQQQFKDIIDSDMVSTPEGFTYKNPIYLITSTPFKKPSAQKALCMFTKTLEVKNKTSYRRFGASKSKHKAIKFLNKPCSLKRKLKRNSKIDEQIKKSLYNWIMHNPQVVKSPIVNDCLEVKMYVPIEPQLVLKLLLQVSVG